MYAWYGNMDPINIPPMLAYIYIPYMDPMGYDSHLSSHQLMMIELILMMMMTMMMMMMMMNMMNTNSP